nr:hypothetical protein E2R29_28435 [Burkholderia pseudomallei]
MLTVLTAASGFAQFAAAALDRLRELEARTRRRAGRGAALAGCARAGGRPFAEAGGALGSLGARRCALPGCAVAIVGALRRTLAGCRGLARERRRRGIARAAVRTRRAGRSTVGVVRSTRRAAELRARRAPCAGPCALAGRAVLTARARIERARIRVARCTLVAAGRAIAGAAGRAFVGAARRLRVGAARARRGRRAGRPGAVARLAGARSPPVRPASCAVRGFATRLPSDAAAGCDGPGARFGAAFAAPRGAAGLAADADFAAGFAAAGFAPAAFGSGRATLRAVRLPERTGARPGVAGRGFLTVNFVRINAGILTLRSRAAARFRLGSADGCRTSRCRRA